MWESGLSGPFLFPANSRVDMVGGRGTIFRSCCPSLSLRIPWAVTGVQESLCKFMSFLCPKFLGFCTPISKQGWGQDHKEPPGGEGQASRGGFQGRQEACVAQRGWSLDSW